MTDKMVKEAAEARIGADRMAMGLSCIPDPLRGDMTYIVERLDILAREYHQHRLHYEAAEAEIERLRAAYDSRGGEMDNMRMVLAETQKWNEDRVAEIERLRSGYQFIIEGHDGYTIALEMMSPAPSADALEPKP